jgi:signal transduction histidine kinase
MFKSNKDLEMTRKYNVTNEIIIINGEISSLIDKLAAAKLEKNKIANELIIANKELALQIKEKSNRAGELAIAKQDKVNRADELAIANVELFFQNKEKDKRADELVIAKQDKVNRADELIIANRELAFQNKEKDKRANELIIANEELAFQNKEKDKRANELVIAKQDKVNRADELVIAKQDKVNRADELIIANEELAFQNKEKDKRANELIIANEELAFQNKEKDKRADELVIAKQDKVNRADELVIAKQDKVNRADELVIANRELAFQNKEKDKRANELIIANEELAFQNKEKDKRADELVIAKQDKVNRADELVIAKQDKVNRADELIIANEELAFQNKEKNKRADELVIAKQDKVNRADELVIAKQDKVNRADELVIAKQDKVNRADELVIANRELAFQNKEKDKRANELVIANQEKVILLQKLQLSQKMEAIGKLTGPISHEYNNMLGIITGYSELIKLNAVNTELIDYANEIQYASKRAAKLTNKLLTLSQKKSTNEDIININDLLERQHGTLGKTLTKNINLIYKLQDNIWKLKIDQSDMEDAILNLCINAMHAMTEHGKLTIKTENKCITREDTNVLNIIPGEYVLLSFTDNGCGFNEKIKDKIFDPFFTTKGELGTGLGLSIVYNFVKNNGGGVSVSSVVDKGTKFTFYFPRYFDQEQKQKTKPEITSKSPQGTGNILLVDDESALLKVTSKILLSNGFNVFCAEDATQALTILESEYIDILISDVIMKNIDGYELAKIVKEKYPDIAIQIVSGFAENRNSNSLDISLYKNMLEKPVDSDVLLTRVRKLLNNKSL